MNIRCYSRVINDFFRRLNCPEMTKMITTETAQRIDKSLENMGASIESLIEIAGFFAFDVITKNIILKKSNVLVMVGPGNNGSDGLVIARYLQMSGQSVTLHHEKIKNKKLLTFAKNCGVKEKKVNSVEKFDYVIDAIFGFSVESPIKEPYQTMINILKPHRSIISIDMPSCDELCVKHLITFIAPKTIRNCENVYLTRSFCPKEIYDEENDYFNHKKIV